MSRGTSRLYESSGREPGWRFTARCKFGKSRRAKWTLTNCTRKMLNAQWSKKHALPANLNWKDSARHFHFHIPQTKSVFWLGAIISRNYVELAQDNFTRFLKTEILSEVHKTYLCYWFVLDYDFSNVECIHVQFKTCIIQ